MTTERDRPANSYLGFSVWTYEFVPVFGVIAFATFGLPAGVLRIAGMCAALGLYCWLLSLAGRPGRPNGVTIGDWYYHSRHVRPDGGPVTAKQIFALRPPALTFLAGWVWVATGYTFVDDETGSGTKLGVLLVIVPPFLALIGTFVALFIQARLRRGHWTERFPAWFVAGAQLHVRDERGT